VGGELLLQTILNDTVFDYLPDGSFKTSLADDADIPPCIQEEGTANCSDTQSQTVFWEAVGLLFQARYWLYLADFGQVSPTLYPEVVGAPPQATPNFTAAVFLPSDATNIFVNSSLYDITVASAQTAQAQDPFFR
jgi:hypothetical protein